MHNIVEKTVYVLHCGEIILHDLAEFEHAVVTAECQGVYCLEHCFKSITHLIKVFKISLGLDKIVGIV